MTGVKGCGYCGGLGHRVTECPKLEQAQAHKHKDAYGYAAISTTEHTHNHTTIIFLTCTCTCTCARSQTKPLAHTTLHPLYLRYDQAEDISSW